MLPVAIRLAALVPILAGAGGAISGAGFLGEAAGPATGSHLRYLSGLLLGLGLCFWSTVPDIETKTGRFRLLTLLVVIGGLARLLGLAVTGVPSFFMLGGLAIELVVTPVLCLWQTRIANAYAEELGVADPTADAV